MYSKKLIDNLLIQFPGLYKIENNFSQAFQDLFVLSMLQGKINGTFLEIGAFDPVEISNTYLLEKSFEWTGLSIDIDSRVERKFKKCRKCEYLTADAIELNYREVLPRYFSGNRIDYLQLDIEPRDQTLAALKALPLDLYRFSVITYETDFYSSETSKLDALKVRDESRKILRDHSYLLVGDGISVNGPEDVFEDWYVDPTFISKEVYSKLEYSKAFNDSGERFLTSGPHFVATEFWMGQGLGNQLWAYTVSRLVAKKRNMKFSIIGRNRFKGNKFIEIEFGEELQGGLAAEGLSPVILPDKLTNYRLEKKIYDRSGKFDISRWDLDIANCPVNCKIDGNFQSYEYIKDDVDEIKSWFKIDYQRSKIPTDIEECCVIHVRGGDFKTLISKTALKEYYNNAINYLRSSAGIERFKCVTDDLEYARFILPDEVEYIGSCILEYRDESQADHHTGGPIELDFQILSLAKYLIIPPSSFSWWAIFLNSTKQIVIAPKYWAAFDSPKGIWSTHEIATPEFTYLDRNGSFFSYEECIEERQVYEKTYREMSLHSLRGKVRNNSNLKNIYSRLLEISFFKIIRNSFRKIN